MIEKSRAKVLLAIFSSILALDIITKWLTQNFLPMMQLRLLPYPYGGIKVFENFFGVSFSINHQTNSGAAWGLFPDSQSTLLYVRVAVILILALYLLFFNKNIRSQIPFIFIISGALGNVLDSLFYGHVIDMFFAQLWGYNFPVFNVADSFIFFGVVWLCILNLRSDKKSHPSASNESKPFNSSPFA